MHWIWIVGWKPVLRGLQMDRPNWSYFCPKTKCRKNDTNSSSKSQSIKFRFLMFCIPCHVFIRIQLRNCKTVTEDRLPTHSTLHRQGATSVIKVRASLREPMDRWRRLSCNYSHCILLLQTMGHVSEWENHVCQVYYLQVLSQCWFLSPSIYVEPQNE